jgi:serine/threonine-protein phosphatase CPPED1
LLEGLITMKSFDTHFLRSALFGVVITLMSAAAVAEGPANDTASTKKPYLDNNSDFRFAIVGDRTGGYRPGVFSTAITQLNLLRPEFVMSVGDLIEGYTEDDPELQRQWQEFNSRVNNLDMPFYYVAGNHDMGFPRLVELWREQFGPTYYHFGYKNTLFLALNTEDPPPPYDAEAMAQVQVLMELLKTDPAEAAKQFAAMKNLSETAASSAISQQQVDYVATVLRENKDVRWTFLFMHKPAWERTTPEFEQIEALLKNRPYTVFGGHAHNYLHSTRHGRDYIRLGTTGGQMSDQGEEAGDFDHLTVVTMTEEGPVITNLLMNGIRDKVARKNLMPAATKEILP